MSSPVRLKGAGCAASQIRICKLQVNLFQKSLLQSVLLYCIVLIYDWAIWKIPEGFDASAELSLDAHQVYNLSGGP